MNIHDVDKEERTTLEWVKDENTPASILEQIAVKLEDIVADEPQLFFSTKVDDINVDDINIAIIQNPNVSRKTLVNLTSKYLKGLTYLLNNPAIDLILLSETNIIEDICIKYKEEDYLVEGDIEGIRIQIPYFEIPPQFFNLIANSNYYFLREMVAWQRNTPIKVLEKLSRDREVSVRSAIAVNPNVPFSLLEKLAEDIRVEVRMAVLKNNLTSLFILQKLVNDPNNKIKKEVAESLLSRLKEANSKEKKQIKILLQKLAKEDAVSVRVQLAWDERTPFFIKLGLLYDRKAAIRKKIQAWLIEECLFYLLCFIIIALHLIIAVFVVILFPYSTGR